MVAYNIPIIIMSLKNTKNIDNIVLSEKSRQQKLYNMAPFLFKYLNIFVYIPNIGKLLTIPTY